jgi:hypothetical protein
MVDEDGKEIYGTLQDSGVAVKKGLTQVFNLTQSATGGSPWGWLVILIMLLIGVAILWWIGQTVVGFFMTALGMLCIVLFICAIGLYGYLRWAGLPQMKGSIGAICIVLLIMLGLFIFVGLSDEMTGFFFTIMPIVALGGLGFIMFKGVQRIEDPNLKTFAVIAVVALVISIPVMEMFVVPKTFGTPLEVKVSIKRNDVGAWSCLGTLGKYQPIQTMTTSLSPYYIISAEASHLMWTEIGTVQKVYVDIIVQKHTGEEGILYREIGKPVYIALDDNVDIWGMVRIPFQPHYAEYQLDARVMDAGGITLAHTTFVYSVGG